MNLCRSHDRGGWDKERERREEKQQTERERRKREDRGERQGRLNILLLVKSELVDSCCTPAKNASML